MTTFTFCVPATLVFSVRAEKVSQAVRDAQAIIDRAQPAEEVYLSGPPNHDVKLWPRSAPLSPEDVLASVRRQEEPSDV